MVNCLLMCVDDATAFHFPSIPAFAHSFPSAIPKRGSFFQLLQKINSFAVGRYHSPESTLLLVTLDFIRFSPGIGKMTTGVSRCQGLGFFSPECSS